VEHAGPTEEVQSPLLRVAHLHAVEAAVAKAVPNLCNGPARRIGAPGRVHAHSAPCGIGPEARPPQERRRQQLEAGTSRQRIVERAPIEPQVDAVRRQPRGAPPVGPAVLAQIVEEAAGPVGQQCRNAHVGPPPRNRIGGGAALQGRHEAVRPKAHSGARRRRRAPGAVGTRAFQRVGGGRAGRVHLCARGPCRKHQPEPSKQGRTKAARA
jgi:hypothetical protein